MKEKTLWERFVGELVDHPIRTFAVICVAAIAIALWFMSDRLLDTLVSPNWCATAIQAEKISPGSTFVGLTTCVELLKLQLAASATNSHIVIGTFSFSLIVLMVIVVAGSRASGNVGPTGINFDIGGKGDPAKDPAAAAKTTAEAATKTAEQIAEEAGEARAQDVVS